MFNLTNTPQYNRPNVVFSSTDPTFAFGQVLSANGTQSVLIDNSRQLQFSMRFHF